MDIIFKIAIFSLPFENLFFAPSAGWATITPIILFIYVIFNYKLAINSVKNYGKIFRFLLLILVPISIINYMLIEETNLNNIINSIFSLFLGLIDLIAFDIYFNQKEKNIKEVINIILLAYYISIIVGILQFVTIKFNIGFLKNIFIVLSKRNYVNMGKVQFTFTEPSYIGMHLFGVLLPIYIISQDKRLLRLIVLFLGISLIISSSVKLIIDTIVVLFIFFLLKNIKNAKIIISIIIAIPILLVTINILYNNNNRIRSIIDKGVYADSSLASRYFRINASIKGYKEEPLHFFIRIWIRKFDYSNEKRI